MIKEHNVGLSALYSKFFEHVILYNETQIPKDFQDPLQLLSRSRNEWNLDEKYFLKQWHDNIFIGHLMIVAD